MGMELEAQELPLHGPNRWPQHSDAAAFQQHLSVYYAQLLDFARTLLRASCPRTLRSCARLIKTTL